MPRLRRTATEPMLGENRPLAAADVAHLRDETDPDPLIEEAAERLRGALVSLDARDEWGRPLAWRQVARIALGPIVTQLRDMETAARLMAATQPAPEPVEQRDVVLDVIQAMLEQPTIADAHETTEPPRAPLPEPDDMPFWPA